MGKFMLMQMAFTAELEADMLSERTKAALAAANSRGVELGRHGAEVLAPKYREETRQRAEAVRPIITELQDEGLSLARMATEFFLRGLPFFRRGVQRSG